MLHQGNIEGQHEDLFVNPSLKDTAERAHAGLDVMCYLPVEGKMGCQGGRDLDDHLTW
jgi:hypothetical protein